MINDEEIKKKVSHNTERNEKIKEIKKKDKNK